MILPGEHKILWAKLDEIKKQTPPSKIYLYAPDPFAADRDFKASLAKREAERNSTSTKQLQDRNQIVRAVNQAMKIEATSSSTSSPGQTPGSSTPSTPVLSPRIRFHKVLTMTREFRTQVEDIIRRYKGFQIQYSNSKGLSITEPRYKSLYDGLKTLGFTSYLAEEALEYTDSFSEALEWLLIHVPEDDLPQAFVNQFQGISAQIQSKDLKLIYALRDIKSYGYSEELISDALKIASGDKSKAVVLLTHNLVYDEHLDDYDAPDSIQIWQDEMIALSAIYEQNFTEKDLQNSCSIKLSVGNRDLTLTFYKSACYPMLIPGIGIESNGDEHKYVILDAIRRTGKYASESLSGDSMILSICQWIEDNFESIVTHPSKLSEISKGIFGDAELLGDLDNSRESTKLEVRKPQRIRFDPKNMMKSEPSPQMMDQRRQLPAWNKQSSILDQINSHQITLITGETGSGKSTQVVQFLLDSLGAKANIVCTQPRRISAMGLAKRVADERNVDCGQQVGYAIRGESQTSYSTQLRFVTTGVLLRMIHSDPGALNNISHVVVDEVHERSLDGDYLLILLKRMALKQKNLKIILMSATVDKSIFQQYFSGRIGYTHIEGRTFPVKDIYLDSIIKEIGFIPTALLDQQNIDIKNLDVGRIILALRNSINYDLISALVKHIDYNLGAKDGGILIFLPGTAEIERCRSMIAKGSNFLALPLHASLTPADQRKVFPPAPRGKRKVVIATNVAETSITIPDIVAVIDSGRVKETVYDASTNVVRLEDRWASQAAVTQRRGRAGRVREGTCYKLYTSSIQTDEMTPHQIPEILRSPLEQLYLSVKAMGIKDAEGFLMEALTPPDVNALEAAKYSLQAAGLILKTGELSSIGKHVSMIPADVRSAKLLVLGSIFGCLDTCLTIVSILSLRSPFINLKEKREEIKIAIAKFSTDGSGDLLGMANAYKEWKERRGQYSGSQIRSWCAENYLSVQTLQDISSTRGQYLSALQEVGLLSYRWKPNDNAAENRNIKYQGLVRALISASMMPNIAEIVLPEKTYTAVSSGTLEKDVDAKGIRYFSHPIASDNNNELVSQRLFIHPSSTMFGVNKFINNSEFISFFGKMQTTKLYITGVNPAGVNGVLFFSDDISMDPLGSGIIVDNWLGLKCWPRIGILVKILKTLFDKVLEAKLADPQLEVANHPVVKMVQSLMDNSIAKS